MCSIVPYNSSEVQVSLKTSRWPPCGLMVARSTSSMAPTRCINAPSPETLSNKWEYKMDDPFLLKKDNAAELFLIRHGDAIPGADEIIPGGTYDNLPLS